MGRSGRARQSADGPSSHPEIMTQSFRIHASVLEDVLVYSNYLRDASPVLANRFRRAVDQSLEMIRLFPEAGAYHQACLPQAMGLRKRRILGFPSYLIIYRTVNRQDVEILRVVHTSRDLPSVLEDESL
jgi:plasmid stabilization system protein ParE